MSHSAKAIANYFLSKAQFENRTLDPMKLQKLIFFAHGWHLGLLKTPLIKEAIEAWEFGPVIPVIYYEFREFGANAINRYAQRSSLVGEGYQKVTPQVPAGDANLRAFLDRIWEVYKNFTGIQLSNLTHEHGMPWALVVEQVKSHGGELRGKEIPQEMIKKYFEGVSKNNG